MEIWDKMKKVAHDAGISAERLGEMSFLEFAIAVGAKRALQESRAIAVRVAARGGRS